MNIYLVKKLQKEKKTEYVKLVGAIGDYRVDLSYDKDTIVNLLDINPSRLTSLCKELDKEYLVAKLEYVIGGAK